jgi:hypothetical protein
MQPERALRILDGVDGLVFAARLACAGYQGRRVRRLVLLATAVLLLAHAFPPG